MTSWIYFFSQFSSEALLFEALLIFLIICCYIAFWILKKRKYGVIQNDMPSGPVKNYLDDLVMSAEQLKVQLFGLLSAESHASFLKSAANHPDATSNLNLHPLDDKTSEDKSIASASQTNNTAPSAELTAQLEAKLAEQAKALQALTVDKQNLELQVTQARSQASTQTSNGESSPELQNKLHELETRLAEYAIIEDDLANLKRLQQENAQLKEALAGKAPIESPVKEAVETTPPPPVIEETPVTPVAEEPIKVSPPEQPVPEPSLAAATPVASNPTPSASETSSPAAETTKVESLDSQPKQPEVQASVSASESVPLSQVDSEGKVVTPETVSNENSEAELVAEFEKMLKG